MATVEAAIFSIQSNDSGVAALVTARIYPSLAPPDATYPLLVYQRIASDRQHAMSADTGLAMALVQLTAWATDWAGAQALSEAARAAMQDYSGTAATVVIQRAFLVNETDRGYDSDSMKYGRVTEYEIWHRE